MAATADGGFLIADFQTARVRQVSPAGIITTVAGSTRGDSGDGGLATAARLDSPADVEVTPDGGFLLADFFEARVRRVSPAGRITTIAGNGRTGCAGDGGPATLAELAGPSRLEATPDGGFLIADDNNNSVRFVDSGLTGPSGPAQTRSSTPS
jgi:hypothetical protein